MDITVARPAPGAPIESTWGAEVHDNIEGVQAGVQNVTAAGGAGTAAITFPRAFASPPVVVACCGANSFYFATVANITATGCVLGIRDMRDAQSGSATQAVQWIAIGKPA